MSEGELATFFTFMSPLVDERQRRLLAGSVAKMLGRGGLIAVANAAGMSRSTVGDGIHDNEDVRSVTYAYK